MNHRRRISLLRLTRRLIGTFVFVMTSVFAGEAVSRRKCVRCHSGTVLCEQIICKLHENALEIALRFRNLQCAKQEYRSNHLDAVLSFHHEGMRQVKYIYYDPRFQLMELDKKCALPGIMTQD